MQRKALLPAWVLSVVVEATDLSRKIFQGMKNCVTCSIACTLRLPFFFLCVVPVAPMGDRGKGQSQDDSHKIARVLCPSSDGNGPHPKRWDNLFHCLRLRGGGYSA